MMEKAVRYPGMKYELIYRPFEEYEIHTSLENKKIEFGDSRNH